MNQFFEKRTEHALSGREKGSTDGLNANVTTLDVGKEKKGLAQKDCFSRMGSLEPVPTVTSHVCKQKLSSVPVVLNL